MASTHIGIGIQGFGRIGRSLLRLLYERHAVEGRDDLRLLAIADPADPKALAYLVRFDTLLGRFPAPVSLDGNALLVGGQPIHVAKTDQPGQVPWGELGVDVVIEASSRPRRRADLEQHLAAGAKRVILCSPPAEPPDLTVVEPLNGHLLSREQRIVSNASSTAHCAGPVAKVLADAFGIERLFLATVHAYTDQQRLADVPESDWRRGRAAAENVIPQETNAGAMLEELIPELAGRVTAMSMNVPVANGSLVDLVCWHQREVTAGAINEVLRAAAASERWRRVLAFETEPIVSSDVLGSSASAVFDSEATMVLGDHVSKTLAWFDNASGYARRVLELIERFAALDREGDTP